jgi:predicted DNA-binding transcriptional regulator YafY
MFTAIDLRFLRSRLCSPCLPMNRTDRLVAIVMHLQGRRVVRAEEIAAHFEISVRTVYRDIAALSEAGVAIAGEAGVGYSLVKGYHLPPVMFTTEEAMALFVGGEMVRHFTDASVAAPMNTALAKIRSVLPADRQDDVDRLAQGMAIEGSWRMPSTIDQRVLLPIQRAIVSRCVLRMTYRGRARDEDTTRDVEPLGVTFFGGAWYLVAWCRLRKDFRHFKLERVRQLELLDDRFKHRPGFSLTKHIEENNARMETFPATVWFSADVLERARRESYGGLGVERPAARGGVEAEMRTFSYPWLARWIVSLGGEAEAIAPASLRAEVRAQAKRVLERHS